MALKPCKECKTMVRPLHSHQHCVNGAHNHALRYALLFCPNHHEVAKIVVEEGISGSNNRCRKPGKIHGSMESCRSKGDPGCCICSSCKKNGALWRRCSGSRGTESGGHIGETTTMALVPQVVDAVKIPVIAAGGIADGRGIAAAFMLCRSRTDGNPDLWQQRNVTYMRITNNSFLKARDIDTRVTGRTTGHPVRTLRNPMTKEYLEKEAAGASFEELEMLTLGGLRKAVVDGDVKTGSVMSGQIAGMVKDVPTCKELMARLIRETKETVKKTVFLWRNNKWEKQHSSFRARVHRRPEWEKIFMRNTIQQRMFSTLPVSGWIWI